MLRAVLTGAFLVSASAAMAADDDHVVQPDTVLISMPTTADAPDLGGIEQPASIQNKLSVSIILRDVTADGVAGKIMRKRSLFGKAVWSQIKFLNIRPNQTMTFGQDVKLVFPRTTKSAKSVNFSFGPKGGLTIER